MSNKIKEIFSNDTFKMNGRLRFENEEAYKNFISALELVYAEGRVVPLEGIASVATEVIHQGATFPLGEHVNITNFIVTPSEEPTTIHLDGDKSIILLRTQTRDKIILCSERNSIVSFCFTFLRSENKHTINYKVQFDNAGSIEEVKESFILSEELLERFYPMTNKNVDEAEEESILGIKEYFRLYKSFFERLCIIEKLFEFNFSPNLLNDLSFEEQQDIDELYLLLHQKRIIRLNEKLITTNETAVTINNNNSDSKINIGDKLMLTFLNTIEFNFLKQKVLLHTANLLVNAIVKDIQKDDNEGTKILYGDTDSKPMYISFSAFRTKEEAMQEMENITQHHKSYENALTSRAYIKKFYSTN